MPVFHLRRPQIEIQSATPYPHAGSIGRGEPPPGHRADTVDRLVGHGAAAYDAASQAIDDWAMFDLAWIDLEPTRPGIVVGQEVTVVARAAGLWVVNDCRISELVDDPAGTDLPARHGFVYVTLDRHAESGEELFAVTWDPHSDEVRFRIVAHSRPARLLSRLGFPLTRRFQARFRRQAADAMQRQVRERMAG